MNEIFSSHWSAALPRTVAMFVKEFLQLRRDRLTFGTMIVIPIIQLTLFGFAINTTRGICRRQSWRMRTAILAAPPILHAARSDVVRLEAGALFDLWHNATEDTRPRALAPPA